MVAGVFSLGRVPSCPVCGAPVERQGARGPIPVYCGAMCRNIARRVRRHGPWREVTEEDLAELWEGLGALTGSQDRRDRLSCEPRSWL